MRQRSLKNQHRMLEVLLERFDAVDVTGLSAWERARAVHGRSASGLAEGESKLVTNRGGKPEQERRAPSASPAQLFEDAA